LQGSYAAGVQPNFCSDVPDDGTERLRAELEGIGIGCEDVEQQAARFERLAAGPCVNLVGFSADGSLSGDGNNGGYSWMAAVVKNGGDRSRKAVCWLVVVLLP
jgi:hypothetical protein